jgi:hypothetical protein
MKNILHKSLKINQNIIAREGGQNFTLKKNLEMTGYSSPATGIVPKLINPQM